MPLIDFILHIDVHLAQLISVYGGLTYAIVFIIIFVETGLVFTPFLPGDSLLFAAGALAAIGDFKIGEIMLVLVLAAILGDTTNFWIGHFAGEKLIANPRVPIKKEHIDKTQAFFNKYGAKTVTLGRFIPIVRTFTPFVAGVGKMPYLKFIRYSVLGALTWVTLFTLAGFWFGNIPAIKHNFSLVIMGIILISILPMIIEAVKHKYKRA